MSLHSLDDLIRLTRDLEAIADWRDDLQSRLHRAQLKFETVGCSSEEHDALQKETEEFKGVCTALTKQQTTLQNLRRAA